MSEICISDAIRDGLILGHLPKLIQDDSGDAVLLLDEIERNSVIPMNISDILIAYDSILFYAADSSRSTMDVVSCAWSFAASAARFGVFVDEIDGSSLQARY